jgi:hypothetical protein
MERAVIACLELIGTAKDDDLAAEVRKSGDDGRQYIQEGSAFLIIIGSVFRRERDHPGAALPHFRQLYRKIRTYL